jgi:hypothetical protein
MVQASKKTSGWECYECEHASIIDAASAESRALISRI